ncbi:reverse transcriptase domain-containing protein [Tanacetum coccineum]
MTYSMDRPGSLILIDSVADNGPAAHDSRSRPPGATGRGSFNEFTWYKNEALYTRIAAYSDQTKPHLTFVSTSWRHPWDLTLGITLIRMSVMANATPIVTTVTKNANNEKAPDAASRVNIIDFCEEHYEDILPIIMEKARRDKRKEVQTRLNFGENPKKTRRERENSLNSRAENSPIRFHPGISRTRVPRDTRRQERLLTARNGAPPERYTRRCVERWAMPTWCHMFNSTLIGAARVWFDELPPESIDGYKGLKAAFLAYFMQQKKYVKDPVEIHNIKQRDGETIEDFMERFKVETGRMKGAPECMRISGFMHGVNNPELTKRLNEHVPKTMEEMMTVTTAFIRGEAAAASKKKGHLPWKSQDQSKRHASERRSDFRGKFKPPPPMVTPAEKRSSNKFCDFHNDKGHSTDECMQLKKQIEELVRAGKLSHLIKEIKQGRDQTKNGKKEAPAKDKSLAIYMIQPWQRMTRQKLTQLCPGREILRPTANSDGTEGPLVIEAEIGGHMIHRMYIDGGSSTEILYEHCFNQLRPEIKNQMVPATTSLTGFSGETIWPLGQLRLLVTIGDADHSTKAWMNFMIVRSLSPYNGIIGRPGIREIQAVPSTAHGMLKFPANGGIVTIRSTILIPAECTTVITSSKEVPKEAEVRPKNFKIALHPNFPDQEVAIGGTLSTEGRTELCSLLKKNLDIFAWQPSDMTGVPRSVAEHRLNIREGYSPVRQKKRGQAPERSKAIQAEVQKLVEAGIMRELLSG